MVCKKKSLLEIAEKELISRLKSIDMSLRKVKDLSEYFETYSPVSGMFNMQNNGDFATNIFTASGYSKIRNKPTRIMENELEGLSRLILVGTDVETFEPLGLSFTSSGAGQNSVIVGTSGSGKTYLYMSILLNAYLNGFKINAMDYKGKEYAVLASIIPNSIILDFGMDSSQFINTLKFIPSLYEKKDWKKAFALNTEHTVRSLRILAGISQNNTRTAENALDNMIKSIYSKRKVYYDDIESYYNTKYIDYLRDIEEGVIRFNSDSVLKEAYGKETCRELYAGLINFFSNMSYKSSMFKNEIDLGDVLSKDCLIYSFNMNSDSSWNSLMEYKIYNQDYVSNLFIQKNKKEGFSTINSLEEYQRAVNFPDLRKIYNSKFSGGRSDNVINVVLTNTIRPLLDKSFDISAIRENISNVFIGKLEDMDALEEFCKIFGIKGSEERIIKLQTLTHGQAP
jgi:ABC-type dipeptide/oligopeptide/nickel transport system ATPase component